jgi:diguanylate cyclase (GGDEF)-like protein
MLSHAALHDQLTLLANRTGFSARLEQALTEARRTGGEVAVLCLDLDRFKQVNDTLGHEAGDQLLRLAARRMTNALRKTDLLARMGGDEFAIVLADGLGAAEAAQHIAQRLLEDVRMPYVLGDKQARIGVSIGIATSPADGTSVEALLRNADTALYQAKTTGRNAWRAYASEEGVLERNRIALEQDLREAVELQALTLVYQPICDAATGLPVAFEALLRWNHARRGTVSPAEFIPLAEKTGLIVPLGRWVIETACAEAATWAIPARIAINLSPVQFRERDLLGYISDVLRRTGLAPGRLEVEVTEGLLLDDNSVVVADMQALRAMGVRMVLDDFGSAHASLSYLRGFPFDQVKIDRSFMRALSSDRRALALVEAMLTMARVLGLSVVGEGVETQEQLTLLRHLRCDLVQGFLLGHPASADAARQWLWQLAAQRGEAPARILG